MMDLTLLSTAELEKLWARTENGAFARKVKEELDQRTQRVSLRGTPSLFGNRNPLVTADATTLGEVARE